MEIIFSVPIKKDLVLFYVLKHQSVSGYLLNGRIYFQSVFTPKYAFRLILHR